MRYLFSRNLTNLMRVWGSTSSTSWCSYVKPVVIWVFRRIKILMITPYELVDFTKVIRIKTFAVNAEVSFDQFGKELRFVGVCLFDFVVVAQCWIVALTLRLVEVFDFAPRLAWIGLWANRAAEFFSTSLPFYPKILLNLFLQLINACLYSRVFNLRVLSPESMFLLN